MTKKSKKVSFFFLSHRLGGRNLTAQLGYKELSTLAGVSQKTARRWINGTQEPHPHSLELLRIKVFGLIPHSGFESYQVYQGKLRTQTGDYIEPRELDAVTWLRGLYYRGIDDNKKEREELNALLALLPSADLIRRKAKELKTG